MMNNRLQNIPSLRLSMSAALAILASSPAFASETITYSYDALGRLTTVSHVGATNTGVKSTYRYDATDNRTTTATARAVVIVPLNGLTVIPIPAR